jgi:uncharacterized protein involved in exopolysaccharide biosynthesis
MVNVETGPEDTTQLRDYLAILRVRKWTILSVAAIGIVGALVYSFRQTPVYASAALV